MTEQEEKNKAGLLEHAIAMAKTSVEAWYATRPRGAEFTGALMNFYIRGATTADALAKGGLELKSSAFHGIDPIVDGTCEVSE